MFVPKSLPYSGDEETSVNISSSGHVNDEDEMKAFEAIYNEGEVPLEIERKLSLVPSMNEKEDRAYDCNVSELGSTEEGKTTKKYPEGSTKSLVSRDFCRARLNVGGDRHEIAWERLANFPETRLGRIGELRSTNNVKGIEDLCDDYDELNNEYFFDRHPKSFANILNLYRKGRVHLSDEFCVLDFFEDLKYWGLDELSLDPCCQIKLEQKMEQINDDIKKDKEFSSNEADDEIFGKGCIQEYRKYLWHLFEDSSTIPQKITGVISIGLIVLSMITLSLSTVPQFQNHTCKLENGTVCEEDVIYYRENKIEIIIEESEHPVFGRLEEVCIAWFTIEYLARLISAPKLNTFIFDWLNTFDLLAILPFYISFLLTHSGLQARILQVLRIFRVLRVFKLARHSIGLQSLGYTLKKSYKDLGVLLLFLSVGVVLCSSVAYFIEKDENELFNSMPATYYWALITMTTVGYGDVVPVTTYGKIVGMVTGVCGVVVISLPIPIIVNNFGLFYEEKKKRDRALKRRNNIEQLKLASLKSQLPSISTSSVQP